MARRLALVTGASAGIGEEFVRLYAAEGCDIALVARRRDRLEDLAAEIEHTHGVSCLVLPADLSDPESPQAVLDAIRAVSRHVDVLVNNAGYNVHGAFHELDWERHASFIQVMLTTPAELMHRVVPGMVERGYGRIINVGSIAAFMPSLPGDALYSGLKSSLQKLSWAVNAEVSGSGVHVTCLCPGPTETGIFDKSGTRDLVDRMPKLLMLDAHKVAAEACRAVERNQPTRVPGWSGRFGAIVLRYAPWFVARPVVRWAARAQRTVP